MRVICLASMLLLPLSVPANVSFFFLAGRLDTFQDVPMPSSGLVYLVVSDDSTFADPTTAGFTSGDDRLVGSWTIGGTDGYFEPAVFTLPIDSSSPAAGLNNPGDFMQLYWFPTLSSTNSPPPDGSRFGKYSSTSIEENRPVNHQPWIVPGDGANVNVEFFDNDADLPERSITKNPTGLEGNATFEVTPVPEPSTYAAGFALGCLAWAAASRRIRRG